MYFHTILGSIHPELVHFDPFLDHLLGTPNTPYTVFRLYAPLGVSGPVGTPKYGVQNVSRNGPFWVVRPSDTQNLVISDVGLENTTFGLHVLNRSKPFGTDRCCKSSSIRQQPHTPFWTPPETSCQIGVPACAPKGTLMDTPVGVCVLAVQVMLYRTA